MSELKELPYGDINIMYHDFVVTAIAEEERMQAAKNKPKTELEAAIPPELQNVTLEDLEDSLT